MRRSEGLLAGVLIAGFCAYVALNLTLSVDSKHDTATVYSRQAMGLSVFQQLREQYRPRRLQVMSEPILKPELLAPPGLFMLLAPTRPVTKLEAQTLEAFVRKGGSLLLAFYSQEGFFALEQVVKSLGLHASVRPNPRYRNQHTQPLKAKEDRALLTAGKTYQVYSQVLLARPECHKANPACFYMEQSVDAGEVILLASLPLLSNAMIGRGDNRTFALDVALRQGPEWVDEYHHFFSTKGVTDLLLEPSLSLPLLGMIVLVLLYFMFGYSEDAAAAPVVPKQRSYHEFNVGLIAGQLRLPGSLEEGVQVIQAELVRLFPNARAELARLAPSPGAASGKTTLVLLLEWHRHQLQARGRTRP